MANIANIIGKLSGIITALGDIKDAINNGGGGGSVTASNVSVVPTSPFVSTNLQNLSVEEANAITSNTGDITTINTALGNTSISGIGDGSVTGAISSIDGDVNTIETALGNTSISGIGDGSVTGAISTLNNSLSAIKYSGYGTKINVPTGTAYAIPTNGLFIASAEANSVGTVWGGSGFGFVVSGSASNANSACIPVFKGETWSFTIASGSCSAQFVPFTV